MTKTTYEYPSADGVVRFKTVRTDRPDGSKVFAQFHRAQADAEWIAKAPPWPRPLWNLPEIEWLEDGATVLVVEGEKTAIAAQALFGDRILVTTWAGGANAVKQTDWAPLRRHRVVHMPDLDRKRFPEGTAQAGNLMPFLMQPGTKAALAAAQASGGALVQIPETFAEDASWVKESGWDLADVMPDGWSLGDVHAWLRAAFETVVGVPAHTDGGPDTEGAAVQAPVGEALPPDHNADGRDIVPHEPVEFITNANGTPKPCFENAVRYLLQHVDDLQLRFDAFANRPVYGDIALEDEHILMIARSVQSAGIIVSTAVVGEAVVAAANKRRFHPVLDYLDQLKWDGVPRIDQWLIDHAGADDTALTRAMSRKWLIQAVARVRNPGCQADYTLILEGSQGLRKSSLLRALFSPKWFTDHLPDLSQKDALVQLQGVWCVEVAEFATFNRSEANKIKQFLTSPTDRFRPPYGRIAKDFPRQCVFSGTVNPAGGYLKDPTGGRRFWPIECQGRIDVDSVVTIRDQLWAEASAAFLAGEAWYIADEKLELEITEAQASRREDDVWEDRIAEYLATKTHTTVPEIMAHALSISAAVDQRGVEAQRVGRILTTFGWHRKQRLMHGRLQYYYAKPSTLV